MITSRRVGKGQVVLIKKPYKSLYTAPFLITISVVLALHFEKHPPKPTVLSSFTCCTSASKTCTINSHANPIPSTKEQYLNSIILKSRS